MGVSWLIIGGESGPGARPFDVAWARLIIAQCKAAGVPCFMKQLGARPMGAMSMASIKVWGNEVLNGDWKQLIKNRKGGDPSEWPADLRVREFPGEAVRA